MVRLLSIGIDAISTILVLLPIMIILRYTVFKRYKKISFLLVFIYAIYLSAAFSVVGIPALNSIIVSWEFNFIPLVDILNSPREYIINTGLNIMLFVPLGFLIPTIWNEYRSLKKVFLIGIGLSLVIEILQIFTFRLTDIDDLITNTLGTIIGYSFSRRLSDNLQLKISVSSAKYEPFIVCLIVFLFMITIQSFISDAIWNYILSSSIWEHIR